MAHADSASESLRIAIVSTCAIATPPVAYGGTELVLADLAAALASLGHVPTVFATGDSTCLGARAPAFARAVWPPDPLAELQHAGASWREIAEGAFDVVHVNHPVALPFAELVRIPTIATIHHDRSEGLVAHYSAYPSVAFVAISRRQAELMTEVPCRAVIHHGLDPGRYPEGDGAGGYCAFLGRFAASKGPHIAIDAARAAGVPIRLGGAPQEHEQLYFEREIAPRLGPGVEWLGELAQAPKVSLLRGALCLLCPIQWEEPFGLVMIEAMLTGTPVIALGCGSAPEVVDEGITGFVVHRKEEVVDRIEQVHRLDRARCRARATERWDSRRMARDYAQLYGSMRHGRRRDLERTLLDRSHGRGAVVRAR
jgi:glycosyltransferase involved in cell wall biosynthesis